MKIFIGADHNGFVLKKNLSDFLRRSGYEVVDEGDVKIDSQDDFPQFAGRAVSALLADGDDESKAILICGSGQGMCMAANRFKGIRASLCWDVREARMARNDDDSNVLCLPARVLDEREAQSIMVTWLNTSFAGAPRFKRRIQQLDELG
ncbi:MAG TPA: RpiB/LacA/LacB family sugar-phosphate isomerase [Candidatus Saccharimonadales bacterium]|nr:RpiB/LacA/LacB family sugar-phosphate isomerase [Candidatus Saccharimonadales bacterium]